MLDYQLRQTGKSAFEILAETAEHANREMVQSELLRQMRVILLEKGLNYVKFVVRFVRQILPDSRTGKKKLVISKCTDGRGSIIDPSFNESIFSRTPANCL